MSTRLQESPLEERVRIVEDLWDSIAADPKALPLTAEQKAGLDLRLDAYEVKRISGLSCGAVSNSWLPAAWV